MSAVLTDSIVVRPTEAELAVLNARFHEASPEALLGWATDTFGQQVVLTCSFGGASGMVLLDMVVRLDRNTPIVFLDTGLLFAETYAAAEQTARHYGIEIAYQRPELTLEAQARLHGSDLYARDPDQCCAIRKVAPLATALAPFDAWISGIRRDQASTRATTERLQWSAKHQVLKVNPLAFWSERDVWRYIHANNVPYNQLLDQGYPSIGCAPCTKPAANADPRAGRWAGSGKIECGIHV